LDPNAQASAGRAYGTPGSRQVAQRDATSGIKKLMGIESRAPQPGTNANIILMNKKSLFKVVDELLMKRLDSIFEGQNAFPGYISPMTASKLQQGAYPQLQYGIKTSERLPMLFTEVAAAPKAK